jgi:hypothetical protein
VTDFAGEQVDMNANLTIRKGESLSAQRARRRPTENVRRT